MNKNIGWVKSKSDPGLWCCPYAEKVRCSNRACSRCGWNPEVAEKRMRQFKTYGKVIAEPSVQDDMEENILPGILDENV